jgi:hypothetical protein
VTDRRHSRARRQTQTLGAFEFSYRHRLSYVVPPVGPDAAPVTVGPGLCPAVYITRSGATLCCSHEAGHAGDHQVIHRGEGAVLGGSSFILQQWRDPPAAVSDPAAGHVHNFEHYDPSTGDDHCACGERRTYLDRIMQRHTPERAAP